MSSLIINDLRITFLWTRTYFDLLQGKPEDFPQGFLSRSETYKEQLATLLASAEIPSGLTLPWQTTSGQLFWTRYFGGCIPGHITPGVAWRQLVPLRAQPQARLRLDEPDVLVGDTKAGSIRVGTEAYYYPFGNALAVTLHFRGTLSLPGAVTAAQMCAKEAMVSLMAGARSIAQGHLFTVAQRCLDLLSAGALGRNSPGATATTDPLTITTVVGGSGVDPNVPFKNHPEKDDIQRFLEGLANWQSNWKTVTLPSLDSGVLLDVSSSRSSPGDLLYAGQRQKGCGRVVWFPGRFTLSSQRLSSLACYHRNLLMATAHVESLARFLDRTVATYPDGAYKKRPHFRWCVQRSALLLKDLHDGVGTYRSWSVREQIRDRGCVPALNTVLSDNGAAPIT